MIVREIITTCSNPHVARAAVSSIGGDFARRFSRDAADRNLSSGLLASRLVRHFAKLADDSDWESVSEATRGADMPILSGLRCILERGLELADAHKRRGEGWRPREAFFSCGEAWRNCA
jgi:hypothetical protein